MGRTENAVKIRWKALNRRQRDARNKAAAAAAAAGGGGGGGGGGASGVGANPSTSTRTGGREGTRAASRAAARAVAARETASRTTTHVVKDDIVGGEHGANEDSSSSSLLASRKTQSPLSHEIRSPSAAVSSKPMTSQGAESKVTRPAGSIFCKEQRLRHLAATVTVEEPKDGALRSLAYASELERNQHVKWGCPAR